MKVLVIYPENKTEEDSFIALAKGFGIKIEVVDDDSYDPQFVKMVQDAVEEPERISYNEDQKTKWFGDV